MMYNRARVSNLSKPLWNCLHSEQSPLSMLEYLIQFMAVRDALHLLQFWFSVDSFRKATSSSVSKETTSSVSMETASSVAKKTTTSSLTSTNHMAPSLQYPPRSNVVSIIRRNEGVCEPNNNTHSDVVDHCPLPSSSSSHTPSLSGALNQDNNTVTTTVGNSTVVEPTNRESYSDDYSNGGSGLKGGRGMNRDDDDMMVLMSNTDHQVKPLADLTRQHSLSESV